MVSYLIFVFVVVILGAIGLVWMFTSELIDVILPFWNAHPFAQYVSADTQNTLHFLLFLFGGILALALLSVLFWAYNKSQKPEGQW